MIYNNFITCLKAEFPCYKIYAAPTFKKVAPIWKYLCYEVCSWMLFLPNINALACAKAKI